MPVRIFQPDCEVGDDPRRSRKISKEGFCWKKGRKQNIEKGERQRGHLFIFVSISRNRSQDTLESWNQHHLIQTSLTRERFFMALLITQLVLLCLKYYLEIIWLFNEWYLRCIFFCGSYLSSCSTNFFFFLGNLAKW